MSIPRHATLAWRLRFGARLCGRRAWGSPAHLVTRLLDLFILWRVPLVYFRNSMKKMIGPRAVTCAKMSTSLSAGTGLIDPSDSPNGRARCWSGEFAMSSIIQCLQAANRECAQFHGCLLCHFAAPSSEQACCRAECVEGIAAIETILLLSVSLLSAGLRFLECRPT